MGNICPFLPREGENYQHCLSDKCYLYNKSAKNCLFSCVDLSKAGNIKALQDSIGGASTSTNDLIKKIGALLTKQSKPLMEYLDTMKNGKAILDALNAIQNAVQEKAMPSDEALKEEAVKIRTALEDLTKVLSSGVVGSTSSAPDSTAVNADYSSLLEKMNLLIEKLSSTSQEKISSDTGNGDVSALLKDINEVNKTAYKGLFTLLKNSMQEQSDILKSLHQHVTGTTAAAQENVDGGASGEALIAYLKTFEPIIDQQQKMHTAVMDVSNALFETKEEILGIHNNLKDYHTENQTQIRTFMENVHEWLRELQKNDGDSTSISELHETLKQMIKNFGSLGLNIAQIDQKIFDKNEEFVNNSAKIGKVVIESIAKVTEQIKIFAEKQDERSTAVASSADTMIARFDALIALQERQTTLLEKMEAHQQKTSAILETVVQKLEPIASIDDAKAAVESMARDNDAFQKTLSATAEKMLEVSTHQEKYMESEITAYKFRKADELNTVAVALLLEKDFSGAIIKASESIEVYPTMWAAYNTLGMAYAESGDTKKAVEVFKKVIAQKSDYSEAYYNLGMIMARDKEFEKAIGLYKASIEKNGSFVKAYIALGDALEANNSVEAALKAWERACMIDPTQTELIEKVAKYKEMSEK